MTVLQVAQLRVRRMPKAADIPPDLDAGEFCLGLDNGRLVIGSDVVPMTPLRSDVSFPYNNVEVLTENSVDFLRGSFDNQMRDVQRAFSKAADISMGGSYVTLRYQADARIMSVTTTNSGLSAAKVSYYAMVGSTPFQTGVLSVMHDGSTPEPMLTDACISRSMMQGNNPSYGALAFRAALVEGKVAIQCLNQTGQTISLFFRMERPRFGLADGDPAPLGGLGSLHGIASFNVVGTNGITVTGSPVANLGILTLGLAAMPGVTPGVTYRAADIVVDAQGRITWAQTSATNTAEVSDLRARVTALETSSVIPGNYTAPIITVDSSGRVTAATPSGAITRLMVGDGLLGNGTTGATLTNTGAIALAPSGVVPGTYANSQMTIDQFGRILAVAAGANFLRSVQTRLPDGNGNVSLTASDIIALIGQLLVPTGTVQAYAGAVAPTGWLICAGQAVSRIDYADLFAIIGVSFGSGNGTTTFNLPDLRGRVPAGLDNMGGAAATRLASATTIGWAGGAASHVLTTTEMPNHTHGGRTDNHGGHSHGGTTDTRGEHRHGFNYRVNMPGAGNHLVNSNGALGLVDLDASTGVQPAGAHAHDLWIANGGQHDHALNITATGGGAAHNNVQPTIGLNYIIKF